MNLELDGHYFNIIHTEYLGGYDPYTQLCLTHEQSVLHTGTEIN